MSKPVFVEVLTLFGEMLICEVIEGVIARC